MADSLVPLIKDNGSVIKTKDYNEGSVSHFHQDYKLCHWSNSITDLWKCRMVVSLVGITTYYHRFVIELYYSDTSFRFLIRMSSTYLICWP